MQISLKHTFSSLFWIISLPQKHVNWFTIPTSNTTNPEIRKAKIYPLSFAIPRNKNSLEKKERKKERKGISRFFTIPFVRPSTFGSNKHTISHENTI